MIDKILKHESFKNKPPVLVDVGASGDIHQIWKSIAKHCVCIAFDPDDRDLEASSQTGKGFKDFFIVNRIVSDTEGIKKFYLTVSPHCSSSLNTDLTNLTPYDLKSAFEVMKEIELAAVTIDTSLEKIGLDYIDWFKTDTQGTDLRIFASINPKITEKILVAEFEPGIMDAYKGEDKLYKIMEFFEKKDFWCDECVVKGMRRIDPMTKENSFNTIEKRFFHLFQKSNAFWAEISYMNQMKTQEFEIRDYLLMSVFSLIKEQYGFVTETCNAAKEKFEDPIFDDISEYAIYKMKINGYKKLPFYIIKKLFNKMF